MKINRAFFISSIIFIGMVFQWPANAQYHIAKSVLSNGGVPMSTEKVQLNSTVGQTLIGVTSDASFSHQLGYWAVGGVVPSDSITWQAHLNIADAGQGFGRLIYGQAATAGDGLDPDLGEAELPPTPPTSNFDVRFELPTEPKMYSLKDYRNDFEETITWRLKFQPSAAGYPITFNWNRSELPPKGEFYLKDEIIGTIVNVNMKSISSYSLTNSAISSLIIEMTSEMIREVKVCAGWNIVSVPLLAADMSVKALFPDATSDAYRFDGGYVTVDAMLNGEGCWLKFAGADTIQISGQQVDNQQIPVKAGWNIIGPFESDVPIAQISSDPSGIIESNFYEFDNGYKSVATLKVGKGYWIKVSQAGTLNIPPSYGLGKIIASTLNDHSSAAKTSAIPQLLFEDGRGETRSVYLDCNRDFDGGLELPPVPPVGIFDVRFNSNRKLETLKENGLEVLISSAQFPVKVRAMNLGEHCLQLVDTMGGVILDCTLANETEIVIPQALEKVRMIPAAESSLPTEYELSQNYPNPFNPTTTILFALPSEHHVKIAVYNTLGKQVETIVDKRFDAGYHSVKVNAGDYSSGVYFYSIEAGDFKSVKKMIVLQ